MFLVYIVHANGHEYIGESTKEISEVTDFVELTKARRVDLIRIPMQTPQGITFAKQIELLPIALCEVSNMTLLATKEEVILHGNPDRQMVDLYNRVIYGIEPASAEERQRILTGQH